MDLDQLREEQRYLASQIESPTESVWLVPHSIVFGVDIQYVEDTAFVAMAAYNMKGNLLETFVFKTGAGMEYHPGYFCFREGPPLLRMIRKIIATQNLIPDVLLIDGHGVAHPRQLGVASYIGLKTNIPTIGIAKRALLPYEGELDIARGSQLPIYKHNSERQKVSNEMVGVVLRTQDDVKPVFISSGYEVPLHQAINLTLQFSDPYRICNPIRTADHAARAYAKGENLPGVIIL